MTPLQRKLLQYDSGLFMASGLAIFLTAFLADITHLKPAFSEYFVALMVLGALILGYGTGRCDESCGINEDD